MHPNYKRPMTFNYQLDEADFVSGGFLKQATLRTAVLRRVVIVGCFLILLGAFCLFVFDGERMLAAVYAGLVLFVTALYPLRIWQYRRQFRKIPALHLPHTLEADEEGVRIFSSLTDGRFSWQLLDRFAENDRAFILVQQGGRVFFPISKRGLTPEQIAAFSDLCKTHIVKKG